MNKPLPTSNRKRKSLAEVQTAVTKMLQGVEHEVEFSEASGHVFVQLKYEDFKPRRVVRDMIEDIADNVEVEQIERAYSDKYMVEALWEASEREEIYVKQGDDFARVDILMLMHDLLMNRTF